jgi:hypothetical protein
MLLAVLRAYQRAIQPSIASPLYALPGLAVLALTAHLPYNVLIVEYLIAQLSYSLR